MSSDAGPSGTSAVAFPELLSDRLTGEMCDVSGVPSKYLVYYQLLPEAHANRWIEEAEDDPERREELQDNKEVANFMANLTKEDCFPDLKRLVMGCYTPGDAHNAQQWVNVCKLLLWRAPSFLAGELDGVNAAENVLDIRLRGDKPWPERLSEVIMVPKLDVLLTLEPSSRAQDSWVEMINVPVQCMVNPALNQVGQFPRPATAPLLLTAASAPRLQTENADVNVDPQFTPAQPLKRSARKPGKQLKQSNRQALVQEAIGDESLVIAPSMTTINDSGAVAAGNGNNSSSSSSSSSSGGSSSSSSSDDSSSDDEPARSQGQKKGNVHDPPLQSASIARQIAQLPQQPSLHPDTPMVVLPVSHAPSALPTTSQAASTAPDLNDMFTFPPLRQPSIRFADLFGDGNGLRAVPVQAQHPAASSARAATSQAASNARAERPPAASVPAQATPTSQHSNSAADMPNVIAAGQADLVKTMFTQIVSDMDLIEQATTWLAGNQMRSDKPAILRGLSDDVLDELQLKLARWIEKFKSVSPSSPPHAVPASVAPAPNEHAAQSARALNVPASQTLPVPQPVQHTQAPTLQPVFQMGKGRIKLPSLDHFSGDAASSKPKVVLAWLRQMQLALQQEQSPDPVSIAIMHLDGNAANWRDTVFLPLHPAQVVPWHVFEDELKTRFMDRVSCMQSLKEFKTLSMRSKQSVQDFNDLFIQRRMELAALPYVSVPDEQAQIEIYLRGLTEDLTMAVQDHADFTMINSLPYWMDRAKITEALKATMKMRLELDNSNKNVSDAQKKRSAASGSTASAPAKSGGDNGFKPSKKSKKTPSSSSGKQPVKSGNIPNDIPQYPGRQLKADPIPDEQLKQLKHEAANSVVDKKTQTRYPNRPYRQLMKRNCEVNNLCYTCFGQLPQVHGIGQCPSPAYKKVSSQPKSAALLAHACDDALNSAASEAVTAEKSLAQGHSSLAAATVQATPFKHVTMLFLGAAHGRQQGQRMRVTVLLDTGSSHNVCSPNVLKHGQGSTGRKFSVACAGSNQVKAADENEYKLTIQNISTCFEACELPLPHGVDILLGQSWLSAHQATLLTWTGQVNFLDDQGLPACWLRQKRLQDNPFNSNVKWSSSAVLNSKEQMFIAYVRTPEHKVNALNSVCAATLATPPDVVADSSQASDAAADPQLNARLQNVFIEQQSTVQGIQEVVQQYQSVFPEEIPTGLPPDRGISHAIPVQTNSPPPASKLYRLSKPQREEMERQISQLLAKGWIRPSSSPYGSPILFVKKKDGGLRMCVDYRAVNKMTVRNSYPLPRIDDLMDRLSGACMFSCLDLQQAYHQVRLNPEDVPKTAFTTPQGLYEYLVLPFGLSNAPSTFQSVINAILGAELRHCCLVYMDDIVVFSKSAEEHLTHLRLVLSKLQGAKLYAKLSKCRFALSSVKFCGHVIDQHGIMPDPEKVKVVLDWPIPTDVHQLRSFVGLAQYFRKFIQAFPSMIEPLTALFKKGAEFKWSITCDTSFQQVKQALTTVPCLKLPDPDEPFTMITDASGVGIGAVLMQAGRPVAFEGRKLTETEQKWSATEQEMLGVVYHMEKWRCYLEGVHFTVVTDHQPNTWFASQKQLSPRQARWYERLRSFDFTWEYRPGRLNVADPLSRNPAYCNVIMASCLDESPAAQCFVTSMTLRSKGPPASVPVQIQAQGKRKWDMRGMLDQAHSIRWGGDRQSTADPPPETPDQHKQTSAPKSKRLKAAGKSQSHAQTPVSRSVSLPTNPDSVTPMQKPAPQGSGLNDTPHGHLQLKEQPDQVMQTTAEDGRHAYDAAAEDGLQLMQSAQADTQDQDSGNMAQQYGVHGGDAPLHTPLVDPHQVAQSIIDHYKADPLYASDVAAEARRTKLGISAHGCLFRRGAAICVPDAAELHTSITRELHCSPYAGHTGMNRTLVLISRYFYWPDMQNDINNYVRGCVVCQRNKPRTGQPAGKLQPLPVPAGIWEDISMDFIGPLPKTARGNDFILVVVDRLSKMAHFLPCKKSIDGPGVAALYVDKVWSIHGLPKSVVTDRGTQFLNAFNAALTKMLGTRHAVSSAYHPETDGQTERVNRILNEMLRHYTNARYDDWDLQLPLCEFAHNNARSSATGMSPFYVCFGKHPLTPMSAVIDAANAAWQAEPQENKEFLSADKFIADRRKIVSHAQEAIEAARRRMLRQEDGKRRPVTFSVGDQVSLRTKHLGISTLPSKKLFPLWLGPFTVSKVINPAAYQLELPIKWKIHNVFHVSLLKQYLSNGEAVDPQSFTLIGGKDNEFEVERIVDYSPKTAHKNGKLRKVNELIYWVKWRGQAYGQDARQPYQNLKHSASDALQDLACRLKLPADIFEKGGNKMPLPSSS